MRGGSDGGRLTLRILCIALFPALLFVQLPTGFALDSAETTADYTARPPIFIATDDDFTADNGVVSGTGTVDDPYVISGWYIEPKWGEGITSDRAIAIGGGVRHSFFLIENNFIELEENSTKGVSVGSPVGGTIRNNIITSVGVDTYSVVLATGVGIDNRQDPTQPLRVEGNKFMGQPDNSQVGIGISGSAIQITGNRFLDVKIAINVGASLTIGPMFIRISENDIKGAEWGAAAAIAHGNTLNVPVINAQNNYWGHPEGPTPTICSNTLGCPIFIGEEKGAYIAPNVVAYPYAEESFYPKD